MTPPTPTAASPGLEDGPLRGRIVIGWFFCWPHGSRANGQTLVENLRGTEMTDGEEGEGAGARAAHGSERDVLIHAG